ncbi:neuronal acetylcholine receptor subunit alpha-10-like isoform X3 [Ptychodera flava]|uniref:neuronal acetylcholine receptor subunit alpha-10-like isoform X3 n=1 Tax=Ptychodera flava TaxID=63121 RepID=UPI00396A8B81
MPRRWRFRPQAACSMRFVPDLRQSANPWVILLRPTTWISLLVTLQILSFTTVSAIGSEQKLFNDLFRFYNKKVRPVKNFSHPIWVTFDMALNQIADMDERNQVLKTNIWTTETWMDEMMRWNPLEYDGIDQIRIPSSDLWMPDITLYNNADTGGYSKGNGSASNCLVSYTGEVMYVSKPTILKSTCLVYVKYFPFDVQACKMKFGSWTYNSLQLNLTKQSERPVLRSFIKNEQWNLELTLTRQHVVRYDCCPEAYPDVTFYVCMRRKPLYYIYNLITPCILLCALSFLGFFMPYNIGVVKANLSVTLILSLTVFLLLVAQMMPRTSMEIPLIGQYYLAAMSLISVSTAMNIAVLNVNVCNREVPRWVQVIVLKYLAIVCFQNCSCAIEPTKPKKIPRDESTGMIRLRPSPLLGRRIASSSLEQDSNHFNLGKTSELRMTRSMRVFHERHEELEPRFGKLESYVEQIFKHLKAVQKKNDKKAALREEWVKVATILDKVLLIMFSIATITTTLSLLLQKPSADTETLCYDIINNDLDEIVT